MPNRRQWRVRGTEVESGQLTGVSQGELNVHAHFRELHGEAYQRVPAVSRDNRLADASHLAEAFYLHTGAVSQKCRRERVLCGGSQHSAEIGVFFSQQKIERSAACSRGALLRLRQSGDEEDRENGKDFQPAL